MAAVNVPALDPTIAFIDPATGFLTVYGIAVLQSFFDRMGGKVDKIDAAHTLAVGAVPQGTQVVASGGLQNGAGGGALGGNIGLTLYKTVDALANIPTVAMREGDWAYALNGRKPGEAAGAGTGVPVIRSGGAWISAYSGAAATV